MEITRKQIKIFAGIIFLITVAIIVIFVQSSNKCKNTNESCSKDNDCCSELKCVNNRCVPRRFSPVPHQGTGKEIVSYLNQVYPLHPSEQWDNFSDNDLIDIYSNLQVLYTPIIGQVWDKISKRIPKRTEQQSKSLTRPYKLYSVSSGQPIINGNTSSIPGEYTQRLFDGSVCDCMRAWVDACADSPRFSASTQYEKNCPQWPGLATVTSLAYVEQLLQIGGYPNNAFVEILTFPGEYGVPENCPLNNQPLSDIDVQPLTFPNNPDYELTGIPGIGPYFDTKSTPECGRGTKIDVDYGKTCITNFDKPNVQYCGFAEKDSNGNITGWSGCDCIEADVTNSTDPETIGLCLDTSTLTKDFRDKYEAKQKQVAAPVCTMDNCTKGNDYSGIVEGYYSTIKVPYGMFNPSDGVTNLQSGCSPSMCASCTKECTVTGDDADLLKQPCPCPEVVISPLFYYPLRGIGIWTNLSKAGACATKMGFVTTPREGLTLTGLGGITVAGAKLSGGGGFKMKDLIGLWIGSTQGTVGIKAQVTTVYQWLMDGKLYESTARKTGCTCWKTIKYYGYTWPPGWEYVAKNRLGMSNPADCKGDEDKCMNGAFELVTAWYQEGFIRHENDEQGFNADMGSWWPCGVMFSYSSAIDPLVTGVMETHQYDSLQQICEPQHSQGSMRPAYVTEIIKAIQKKGSTVDWIHSKSTDRSGCESSFIVNPMDDFDTWKKHGYVAAEKTLQKNGGTGVIQFDHRIMSLTPSHPNEQAVSKKSW